MTKKDKRNSKRIANKIKKIQRIKKKKNQFQNKIKYIK